MTQAQGQGARSMGEHVPVCAHTAQPAREHGFTHVSHTGKRQKTKKKGENVSI